MLLTITTTRAPATDLGYLLHKHPDRLQSSAVAAGQAHVFYPEAAPERCTAALLLEVDPIGLVRDRKNAGKDTALGEYVNDRPYAASSMLAVAIKEAFRTAPRNDTVSNVAKIVDCMDLTIVLVGHPDLAALRPEA